jgi:hypothetical protein
VLAELQEIVKRPSSLVSILGRTVPGSGSFFINYLIINGPFPSKDEERKEKKKERKNNKERECV